MSAQGPHDVHVGDLVATADGPVILVTGEGPVNVAGTRLDAGGDAAVVGLDWQGRARWHVRLRAPGHVTTDALSQRSDGRIVFLGSFSGQLELGRHRVVATGERDCFFAVLAADGKPEMLASLGGEATTVCRDLVSDGDMSWIVGSFGGELSVGERRLHARGLLDVFVARISVDAGTFDAGLSFGTLGEDVGRAIVVDAAGLVIAGSYGSPFGPDGKIEVSDADRALAFGPDLRLSPVGDADAFVAAIDRSGRARWATPLAGPGFDVAKDVVAVDDGFVVSVASQLRAPPPGVSGLASDVPMSGYVTGLDRHGEPRWRWAHPSLVSPHGLAVIDSGVVVVGHYRDGLEVGAERWETAGDIDAFVVALDPDGKVTGGTHCGGPQADLAYAVATAGDDVFFVGSTSGASSCAPGRAEVSRGYLARTPR